LSQQKSIRLGVFLQLSFTLTVSFCSPWWQAIAYKDKIIPLLFEFKAIPHSSPVPISFQPGNFHPSDLLFPRPKSGDDPLFFRVRLDLLPMAPVVIFQAQRPTTDTAPGDSDQQRFDPTVKKI